LLQALSFFRLLLAASIKKTVPVREGSSAGFNLAVRIPDFAGAGVFGSRDGHNRRKPWTYLLHSQHEMSEI
jgi:hypothetical protein